MDELRIGDRKLMLVAGDITRLRVDAIVNAANEALIGGGGVDGAIHRAGGSAVMDDLDVRYGPIGVRRCPTGSAVVGAAGALPARWVIHAVGPVWRGGGAGEAASLASAYRVSMRLANEVGARTVALPAISCGVYGYPLDAAARIATSTVAEALAGETTVELATFVLFSDETREAFRAALTMLGERG